MDTMGTPHSQGVHVCHATVIHLGVCTRAVTTRASVHARRVSLAEIAPSVLPAMSPLQVVAYVCVAFIASSKLKLPCMSL